MLSFIKKLFGAKEKPYKDLNVNEFKALIGSNTILVDVRTPQEFESGKIQGAQNINVASFDFLKESKKLDASKTILVYCKSGGRSARAANMLSKIGFTQVVNLKGGITAWMQAGEPTIN